MNRLWRIALGAILLWVLFAKNSQAAQELRVTAIPDENPDVLARKFAPLGVYLERVLGTKVTWVPAPDYQSTVDWLAAKKVDMVWFGGFTFAQARLRTKDARPLVQREEDRSFHSKVIVPASSKAQTLADLKGGTFAFGATNSTSGHLMPWFYLSKNNIDPKKDFSQVIYSGAHDTTVKLVEQGKVDAGVVNESVLEKLLEERRSELRTKIRIIWTTPAFVDYNWTVRGDLDPKLTLKLQKAFLALDPTNPEHVQILDLQRTKRFVPASVESYFTLMWVATSLGVLKK